MTISEGILEPFTAATRKNFTATLIRDTTL